MESENSGSSPDGGIKEKFGMGKEEIVKETWRTMNEIENSFKNGELTLMETFEKLYNAIYKSGYQIGWDDGFDSGWKGGYAACMKETNAS